MLLSAIEQGYSVCAYSGELTKEKFQEWINFQLAGSEYIGLKFDPTRGIQVPFVPFAVQERLLDYYRDRFYLFDNQEIFESNQSESILQVFQMAARRYGCKLFLADNPEWKQCGLTYARLMFTTENPWECVQALERYQEKNDWAPPEFTRGLYYRGVE